MSPGTKQTDVRNNEVCPYGGSASISGISHFPTAAIKFSCFTSNEIGVLCLLSLALVPSLLIQVSVDRIKI